MPIASLARLPLKEGKIVFVRADLNVPIENGKIVDDARIRASLPTIQYLLKKKTIVLLASHLGRPNGVDESLRMDPVAERLQVLLKQHVLKLDDCVGSEVEDALADAHSGDVFVLENLRFHPEEEANDDSFARAMAEMADFYVNDAFGSSHRAHASVVGMPKYLKGAAGFLLEKEISMLSRALKPKKPFIVVLGGAKVGDKIGVIEILAKKSDRILIGGGMLNTFLKAKGLSVGAGRCEKVELAKKLLVKYKNKLVLPDDVVVSKSLKGKGKIVSADSIPSGMMAFDIGPKTISGFTAELRKARTVLWNGPMGVFEVKEFSRGTKAIAQTLAALRADTIVGGGDTVSALHEWKLAEKMSHVSTGGGASLEFLEGKKLPGIRVLESSK